jgi:hypothetical protein
MSAEIHVLKFLTGKYKGEEFPLGPDGRHFIAGRSSEADLVLADDAVSRKHARFYIERRRTWVRDLCSRNGTLVNGAPVKRHCLRPGDKHQHRRQPDERADRQAEPGQRCAARR